MIKAAKTESDLTPDCFYHDVMNTKVSDLLAENPECAACEYLPGNPEETKQMKIRPSEYNYYVRTEDHRYLIWNTLSDALVRRIADEFSMHPFIYAYTAPGYGPGKEYPLSLTQEVFRLNLILKESGMAYKSERVLPVGIHMGYGACNPYNYTVDPEGRLNGGYRDEKNWNERVSDGAGCRCPGGNPDRVFGERQTGSD